ncbi:24247_t:CDS:2, partial [Cetraspora pellucida]
ALKLVMSSLQSTTKLNYSHYTYINFTQLILENKMLKNEIKSLKVQLTVIQKELETYKSPRISSLYSVFKKMLLFAKLFINNKSWQKLKETNKETKRKVEE